MAAIFSHRATLHKVCAVLPQERTGFSMSELIATLEQQRDLPDDLLCSLLETDRYDAALFQAADRVRRQRYGTDVFVRGFYLKSGHFRPFLHDIAASITAGFAGVMPMCSGTG